MFHFHKFKNIQPMSSSLQLKQSQNINMHQSQSFNLDNNHRRASYITNDVPIQNHFDDYSDILNANILSNLTKGNISCIEEFLDKMLNMNIEAEPNVIQIISAFQLILSHLFEKQSMIHDANNTIESYINESQPSIIDSRILRNKTVISTQQKVINELKRRQATLKKVIITNGHESKLLPQNIPIPRVIYVCDVCKDNKQFKVYDDFHAHYVKNHIMKGNDGNQLYDLETNYFDKKMKAITEELRDTLMNKEYDESDNDEFNMNDYYEDEEKLMEIGNVAQLNRGNMKINVKSQKISKEKAEKNQNMIVEKDDLELLQMFKEMRKKQDDEYDIIKNDIKQFQVDVMQYIKDMSNK